MNFINKWILFFGFILGSQFSYSQIKISDSGSSFVPHASAILDLESSSKGLLLPRVNNPQAVQNPTDGLIIFSISDSKIYLFRNSIWQELTNADLGTLNSLINNKLNANNGVGSNLTIIDSILINNIYFGSGGGNISSNLAIGKNVLRDNSNGGENIGIGESALRATTGSKNIAIGSNALLLSQNGNSKNIAIGDSAGWNHESGNNNIAIGYKSTFKPFDQGNPNNRSSNQFILANSLFGTDIYDETNARYGVGTNDPTASLDINGNIRIRRGAAAGYVLTSDANGLASWVDFNFNGQATSSFLLKNDTASLSNRINSKISKTNDTASHLTILDYIKVNNMYIGTKPVKTNLVDNQGEIQAQIDYNTVLGVNSLYKNIQGIRNIAIGDSALFNNTNGSENIGIGFKTLKETRTNVNNLAIGNFALLNLENSSLYSNNISIGSYSGSNLRQGSYNISIGVYSQFPNQNENGQLVIGNSIFGTNIQNINNFNLGIRTNSPTGALDINGTIRIRGGNPGESKVLVSSNDGTSSWENLSNNTFPIFQKIQDTTTNLRNSINLKLDKNNGIARNLKVIDSLKIDDLFIGRKKSPNLAPGGGYYYNLGIGYRVLNSITYGASQNTAIGDEAMLQSTSAVGNTAIGYFALNSHPSGFANTAIGANSLRELNDPNSGFFNTAIGSNAMLNQTSGNYNIGIGANVDLPNLTGSNQLAISSAIYGTDINSLDLSKIGLGVKIPTAKLEVAGNIKISGNGSKIEIQNSSNPSAGTFILNSSGQSTISTNVVTANSIILLTPQSGNTGNLGVTSRVEGTSFTVSSSSGYLDYGKTIGYLIIN